MTEVSRPTALITGASRGIGRGIADQLARDGWDLTLIARSAEALELAQAEFEALGSRVAVIAGDMTDDEALSRVVSTHEAEFGQLNALVLAAGVGSAAPLAGYRMSRFDKQFEVNARAPFALVSQALPMLRKGASAGRASRIVALSSIEGVYPQAGLGPYGVTKAALIALTQAVNAEENVNGVSATAICPAFVDTDMSAWINDKIAPDQMITVEDVVKVVQLVLSLSSTAVLPQMVLTRAGGDLHHA